MLWRTTSRLSRREPVMMAVARRLDRRPCRRRRRPPRPGRSRPGRPQWRPHLLHDCVTFGFSLVIGPPGRRTRQYIPTRGSELIAVSRRGAQRGACPDRLSSRRRSRAGTGRFFRRSAEEAEPARDLGVSIRRNHSMRPATFRPTTGPAQIFSYRRGPASHPISSGPAPGSRRSCTSCTRRPFFPTYALSLYPVPGGPTLSFSRPCTRVTPATAPIRRRTPEMSSAT